MPSMILRMSSDTILIASYLQSLIPPYCITSPSQTGPLSETVSCIISESNGYISLLDTKFQSIKRWKGWDSQHPSNPSNPQGLEGKAKGKARERGVMLLECGGVLLGIGVSLRAAISLCFANFGVPALQEDDAPSHFPILKIWDLLHDDNKTKQPVLMRNVRLGTGGRGYPVCRIHLPPCRDEARVLIHCVSLIGVDHLFHGKLVLPRHRSRIGTGAIVQTRLRVPHNLTSSDYVIPQGPHRMGRIFGRAHYRSGFPRSAVPTLRGSRWRGQPRRGFERQRKAKRS